MINTLQEIRKDLCETKTQFGIPNLTEIYVDVKSLYNKRVDVYLVSDKHSNPSRVSAETCSHINGYEIHIQDGESPVGSTQFIDLYNSDGHKLLLDKLSSIKEDLIGDCSYYTIKVDLKTLEESSPFNLIVCSDGGSDNIEFRECLLDYLRSNSDFDLANVLDDLPSPYEEGWVSL